MQEEMDWSRKDKWCSNLLGFWQALGTAAGFLLGRRNRFEPCIVNAVLAKALEGHSSKADIYDHLNVIFFFAVEKKNSLMVELGTRGGHSTCSLLAAASINDARLLSIDMDDCSKIQVPFHEHWTFIQADDVRYGNEEFIPWCKEREIKPSIDLLFIDTSHEYEHTKQELAAWFPHLSEEGTVVFHDTNMGKGIFAKMNGTISLGWDNQRGVVRAIEEYLGIKYDENKHFIDLCSDFSILHFPYSNGLTILKKRPVK